MLDELHRLPDLLVLAIFVFSLAGIAFASPFVGRMVGVKTDDERDLAVFDAFKAVMAMAGVVLAFSLVQADNNMRADQGMVGSEARAMQVVDRALLRFGDPALLKYRPLLAAFGRSQLTDEWPQLVTNGRNPTTDARYTALSRVVRTIEPQNRRQEIMYTELIEAMDSISDDRETLIQDTKTRLPDFFWIVSGSFVVLGLVLGVLAKPSIARATALSGTAAAIGLLLSFILIVDQPFQGQTSVKTTPIERVLVLNSRRR